MMNLIVIGFLLVSFIAIFIYCKKSKDYEPVISIIVISIAAIVLYKIMELY